MPPRKPVDARVEWTAPIVSLSETPYQRSGAIDSGLPTSVRLVSRNACRNPRCAGRTDRWVSACAVPAHAAIAIAAVVILTPRVYHFRKVDCATSASLTLCLVLAGEVVALHILVLVDHLLVRALVHLAGHVARPRGVPLVDLRSAVAVVARAHLPRPVLHAVERLVPGAMAAAGEEPERDEVRLHG